MDNTITKVKQKCQQTYVWYLKNDLEKPLHWDCTDFTHMLEVLISINILEVLILIIVRARKRKLIKVWWNCLNYWMKCFHEVIHFLLVAMRWIKYFVLWIQSTRKYIHVCFNNYYIFQREFKALLKYLKCILKKEITQNPFAYTLRWILEKISNKKTYIYVLLLSKE